MFPLFFFKIGLMHSLLSFLSNPAVMFYFSRKFNFPVPHWWPFSDLLNGPCPLLFSLYRMQSPAVKNTFTLLKSAAQRWFFTCSPSLCIHLSWVSPLWFLIGSLCVTSQRFSLSLCEQDFQFAGLAVVSFLWIDPRSVTVLGKGGCYKGCRFQVQGLPPQRMMVVAGLFIIG